MQWLVDLFAHPATVLSVVIGLILWAGISAFFLYRGTRRVRSALRAARRELSAAPDAAAFVTQYERIGEKLSSDPILGHRWKEYRETLVLVPNRPIGSTSQPEAWFSLNLLRGVDIDLRYHAALPNLLVGAGLLVTFLGLAVALYSAGDMVAEGVTSAARNAALRRLLDAASVKFITSIAGLSLSILYALFRKKLLKQVEQSIDGFNAALEQRLHSLTAAGIQVETNRLLETQTKLLETFSNDLAVSVGDSLSNALDQRLGEHIGPLAEAMQTLASGMGTRNEDAMQRMLDAFLDRLQGGAGDHMATAAEQLAGLGARLEGLQSGLGEAAIRMAESADAMGRRMGEGAEAALGRITDQMGGLAESLRAVADDTRRAGTDAGGEFAARIEAAAAGFEGAARAVATTLTSAAEGMELRMGEEAAASTARLAGQFEAMLGELRALSESSRAAGSQAFEALAARIAESADLLSRATAETGGSLGRGAEEAVGHLVTATEGMRTELQTVMQEVRTTFGGASDALRRGGEDGADRLRESLSGAGETLGQAVASAADRLRSAGETAGSAVERGGEAAGMRLDAAAGTLSGGADALGRQFGALQAGADAVVARLRELDAAARAAASPLAATASDLRATAEAAQAASRSLAEAAHALAGTQEQFAGTVQRLDGTHAATGRLIESLTGTSRQFTEVDKALAGTVTSIQTGLQGFTREVTKFVVETDKNLATAANYLNSVVQDLDGTIEDLIQKLPPRH